MKNYLLLITALFVSSLGLTAQVVVNSNITTNTTWTKNNIYLLQGGCLYVNNNATLTIEAGTLIRGDQAALIVTRGAKLIADGTAEQPIVFTSSKPAGQRAPGDWGGVMLCGRAPINVPGGEATVEGGCSEALFGGADPADNSGILRYVRIEFAGIPFQPNNELNSLTMGGVGNGTVIEHVQSSYGGDDAFEWFGGTVNGKYLVTFSTVDDMFDSDFGYSGKNQWVLGISDPNIADVSGSNAFESDNDAQGSTNGPKTNAHFSNVTILGPLSQSATINSNFRRALHIRRCSYIDVFNSAFTGFPTGLLLDGACTVDGFTTNGEVEFVANTMANQAGANLTTNIAASLPAIKTKFAQSGNDSVATIANLMLANPFNFSGNPDFRPLAGSPLLSGANFSSPTLDAFFTPTTYRGAMGDTDWTDCWTEWDPINANYEVAPINYAVAAPVITPSGATTFCAGGSVTLSAPAGFAYEWSNGATTQTIAANTAGSYTVKVTNTRGCSATSAAVAVTVNPNPTANFNFSVNGAIVTFANTSTGANTYLWDFGDGNTAAVSGTFGGNVTHTYAAAGNYTVCLTANTTPGCTNQICKVVNGVQPPTETIVSDDITSSTTWTKNNIYILQGGCLYVRDGVTLTVEPGTVIRGEGAALLVQRGAKLIANGTVNEPIVFTSNRPAGQRSPGDWGGIILCGRAPINVPGGEATIEGGCSEAIFGGNNPADNSGILRYVRIEFAGIPFQPNNELNSLTMGGVGTGTIIEHVQSSYGGDDAFEWFGGTVNGKYLVTFRTVDDMFDTDFGYSGKNQWVLGISDPAIADVSGSNAFESDNDAQGTTNGPKTNAHFSNVTILGPLAFSSTINTNYRRALHIRRCSYLDVFNSAFSGFPTGLLLDGACTIDGFTTNGEVEFVANTMACQAGANVTASIAASLPAVKAEFASSGNDSVATVANLMLANPFAFAGNNPDFRPNAGSPLLSGANFTSPTVTDPFFTPTTYRGAMGDTDWTDCWTEWDPINANYTNAINYGLTPGISSTINDHEVAFAGTTTGAISYAWNFGDGNTSTQENPIHNYAGSVGTVTVTLTVTSARGCVSETSATIGLTGTNELAGLSSLNVFPNPLSNRTFVEFNLKNQMELDIQLLNVNGKVVNLASQGFNAGFNRFEMDATDLNAGIYFLRLRSEEGQRTVRISVIK